MKKPEKSTRQQRRERTHTAIHEAALTLVQEKGLKATTTDEIAEAAGVSPRTLFNYFASKEDAVLGLRAPTITDDILQKDAARQDLYIFERVAHLMLDIIVAAVTGPTFPRVRPLVQECPELRYRIKTHHIECEKTLADLLRTVNWVEFSASGRRGPWPYLPATEADASTSEPRLRAALCITSALLRYLDYTRGVPEEAERDQVIREAVQTFRHLLRED
ncbi:TetR/AcrR family transcriptional regulator [Rothia nasisuis]|uniref:TetR/AcrR family transcriptional regulator n=1 Tax=Rothia nasisuis TaxID=2109647 RepID=UPI001F321D6F|nr:TetR/AcrR family transcriptional regulator [Rothia nasisuis]